VIVGLGNPGRKYANTRHNAGFLVADELVSRWSLSASGKPEADWFEGHVGDHEVFVLKPQTYMNNSGQALHFLSMTNLDPSRQLLIIADDFAIPLGTFRLRPSGSAGGHNGLKSVEQELQTNEYARLRVGVGPLPTGIGDWADFVLMPWDQGEREVVDDLLPTMADAVDCWVTEGIEVSMNRFNRKASPG